MRKSTKGTRTAQSATGRGKQRNASTSRKPATASRKGKQVTRNGAPYPGTAFSVRVRDDATRKRLQAAAKKRGVSMTAFMRDAVNHALDLTLKRAGPTLTGK